MRTRKTSKIPALFVLWAIAPWMCQDARERGKNGVPWAFVGFIGNAISPLI